MSCITALQVRYDPRVMTTSDSLLHLEPVLRLGAFLLVLAAILLGERLAPFRTAPAGRLRVQITNLALLGLGSLAVRLLLPWLAIDAASWAMRGGIGLGNLLRLAAPLTVPAGVVLLDLALYVQHRAFHRIGWLWALHAVHHCERHLDATTGLRFHPGEIMVSMLWKSGVVVVLGIPAGGVFLFEVILNAASIFEHANIRLPPGLERSARTLIVTPAMHRWHHSTAVAESLSNFGFCLPWWDRWFGTYEGRGVTREEPVIGLPVGEGFSERGNRPEGLATDAPGLMRMIFLKVH